MGGQQPVLFFLGGREGIQRGGWFFFKSRVFYLDQFKLKNKDMIEISFSFLLAYSFFSLM